MAILQLLGTNKEIPFISATAVAVRGQVTTTLPVLSLSVSAKGVVASSQEDSKASYIYLYKKDGSALDIYVKSLLSGDGYPVDVSLSPSGTQWITSFMYLEQE